MKEDSLAGVDNYPIARSEDVVIKKIDDELLIYDLKVNKAFCLNEIAVLVWQGCNGKNSVGKIQELAAKKLNKEIEEDLVWLTLEQLNREQLIENTTKVNEYFQEITRREIIKKVGFGSLVALPIVSSVVAPPAVHAQSNCQPSGTLLVASCGQQTEPGPCNTQCEMLEGQCCSNMTQISCVQVFSLVCDCTCV